MVYWLVMVTSWAGLVKVQAELSQMFSSVIHVVHYTYDLA